MVLSSDLPRYLWLFWYFSSWCPNNLITNKIFQLDHIPLKKPLNVRPVLLQTIPFGFPSRGLPFDCLPRPRGYWEPVCCIASRGIFRGCFRGLWGLHHLLQLCQARNQCNLLSAILLRRGEVFFIYTAECILLIQWIVQLSGELINNVTFLF